MKRPPSRRGFLATVLGSTATALAGCGQPADADTPSAGSTPTAEVSGDASNGEETGSTAVPGTVGLDTLVDGLEAPVHVAFPPGADRRYVVDRPGRILVHEDGGLRDEPLLDVRDAVVLGGERGLLGVALHPAFETNRRLFVRYSAEPREGTPSGYSHTFVLAEFAVDDDGLRASRESERTVLEIPQPQGNHNAGDLAFGPDGYLYVPVGDGGAGGDRGQGHVEDWYDGVGGGNGQDVTENLLGSMLRLDVDATGDDGGYAIPPDNPLIGRPGLDEHYAWGLRNPWRISFDGQDLFVADVGQRRYEEVNLVEKGGNYGWNVSEGAHCYRRDDCPTETPPDVRGGEPLLDPIVEYPHSGGPVAGVSVIGGYVYRGSTLPGLDGTYVFGDLRPEGRLFVATRPEDGGVWPVRTVELAGGAAEDLQQLISFGRDDDGEVYVVGWGENGGSLSRVVPSET